MVLLAILVISALGRAKLVPGRWQATWELALEFMLDTVESGLGRTKMARRLFPLVATLFIFILFANWFSLLPGVGTIGPEEFELKAKAGEIKAGSVALAPATAVFYKEANRNSEKVKPGHAATTAEHSTSTASGEHSATPSAEAKTEVKKEETKTATATTAEEPLALRVLSVQNGLAQVERIGEHGFMANKADWGKVTLEGKTVDGPLPLKDAEAFKAFTDVTSLEKAEIGRKYIPIIRPPNADLNMTLAMALVAVIVANIVAIISHGVGGWVSEFFPTKGFMDVLLFPIEIIGQFSRVLSLCFRLFGNIFAGEALLAVILTIAGPALVVFLALELFFGFLQALVFASLTTVFLGLAVAGHGDGHGHEEGHGHGHDEKHADYDPELHEKENLAVAAPVGRH